MAVERPLRFTKGIDNAFKYFKKVGINSSISSITKFCVIVNFADVCKEKETCAFGSDDNKNIRIIIKPFSVSL